jgi:hypothetical protein
MLAAKTGRVVRLVSAEDRSEIISLFRFTLSLRVRSLFLAYLFYLVAFRVRHLVFTKPLLKTAVLRKLRGFVCGCCRLYQL